MRRLARAFVVCMQQNKVFSRQCTDVIVYSDTWQVTQMTSDLQM